MKEALIRSFLAIDLHAPMQAKLEEVVTTLRSKANLPVRWVAGKNIHLTLKFLGESELDQLRELENAMLPCLQTYASFDIRVGGLGAFPVSGHPRVIWVGVQAPPILEQIANEVESISVNQGYERENRRFSPHLTLGRVSQSANPQQALLIREMLHKTQVAELGTIQVDAVTLIQSVLTPAGPIYSPLSVLRFSC